jgi:predicted nucleotidyltransferase
VNALSTEQIDALRQLDRICGRLRIEAVIIGAVAYRIWINDAHRHTYDVDAAVAIELDDFPRLADQLKAKGWKQNARMEQRWETPQGARLDLIPAGPALRQLGHLVWPVSGMKMSLAGFGHAFADAAPYPVAPDLTVKVVSLPTLALLKISSYLDNPNAREKDLQDLGTLLLRYDPPDEERFAEDVLAAGLEYETVPPYLIGKRLAALCSVEEAQIVSQLLAELKNTESRAFNFVTSATGNIDERAIALIDAFSRGFQSQA